MKYILYCFLILFLQCSILYDKRTGDLSIKLQGWRAENKNPVLLQIDEKLIGKLRFLFENLPEFFKRQFWHTVICRD
ncbi:MAG TPA: hypothetical protein PL163_16140, partial [Leptospiraceae bacterium]|nr:hypothetical protein [Leptospiraceae bacterium]